MPFSLEFLKTSSTHASSLEGVSHVAYRFLPPRSRSEVEVKCRYCVCTLPLRKRQIYLSLVKVWISLSGVNER